MYFPCQRPYFRPFSRFAVLFHRSVGKSSPRAGNGHATVRAAAKSFRVNPAFDTEEAISALGVGEALVSVLDDEGIPTMVERAFILPPRSSMSAATASELQSTLRGNPLKDKYGDVQDRESAYEILSEATQEKIEAAEAAAKEKERKAKEKEEEKAKKERERKFNKSIIGKVANSAVNTIGREVGRKLVRGLLDTLLK